MCNRFINFFLLFIIKVCTPEEQQMFNGDTGKASKLYEQLLTKEKPKGLEQALQQRDKLLEFDKNR